MASEPQNCLTLRQLEAGLVNRKFLTAMESLADSLSFDWILMRFPDLLQRKVIRLQTIPYSKFIARFALARDEY